MQEPWVNMARIYTGIYLIIGTSQLYKGLLNDWFSWLKRDDNSYDKRAHDFPELVINDDELYFFRAAGKFDFSRLF